MSLGHRYVFSIPPSDPSANDEKKNFHRPVLNSMWIKGY